MHEVDKERYFREKEAYERVTGQVLPVPNKVVRLNLQAFPISSGGFFLWLCIGRPFRGHQVTVIYKL